MNICILNQVSGLLASDFVLASVFGNQRAAFRLQDRFCAELCLHVSQVIMEIYLFYRSSVEICFPLGYW